ncbi:MMPL family transporter [Nocardia sp. NPDC058058]|uniref:MMPL family transporter n=1 Tax=Nocardia sp. NPDC058058 TaxID=3346317 RepID=UPI0036D7CDB6
MFLTRLTDIAQRSPRRIVAAAVLFLVLAGVYAAPATWKLAAGGFFNEPGAESTRAEQLLEGIFSAGGEPLVLTVSTDAGADSPAATARGKEILAALQGSPYVRQPISYWTTPAQLSGPLLSRDHRTGLVAAQVVGDDVDAPARARELVQPLLGTWDGVTVTAGGQAMVFSRMQQQTHSDLLLLEAIAIPLTFLALVWIFGSAVASVIPLLVAFFAIAGTTATLWTLHWFTGVSSFAINVATACGLAMAVDYTLLMVSRFREETRAGRSPQRALAITMATAGRTVTFSALIMGSVFLVLTVFPQYMLRSMGFGGAIAIGFALFGALLIAPALLVLLGSRLDAFDLRTPVRRWFRRPPTRFVPPEQRFWYRAAHFATRRPIAVVLVVGGVLAVMAAPLLGIKLGFPDDRALQASTSVRQTGDVLRADFPQQNLAGQVVIVIPGGVTGPGEIARYAAALSDVDGVTTVAGPNGLYTQGRSVGAATFGSAIKGHAAYLTVSTNRDPLSDNGKQQLAELKRVAQPAPALFTGLAQRDIDNTRGVTGKIPVVLLLVAVITLILMFAMTGSVVLPIKAFLLNLLSLGAGLGALVWIFQDGHLEALGTTATGAVNPINPPFLACVAYALAVDYELFVLARIREEWLASPRTAADNERSVALGMAHTGRLVTAAATIMIIVFAAMCAGQVSFMRALGFGLTIGVLVDAFLIRTLLVPAFMTLLGRANWWAPRPLARWHRRIGLGESAVPDRDPEIGQLVADPTTATASTSSR